MDSSYTRKGQVIINPKLAKSVRQAWIADQEHPGRGRDKRDYPDEKRLAEVLDVAFCASLLNEEGRPIRGSLTLLSPEELASLEIPKRRESPLVVRLSDPRQFDAEVVAKLAPATDTGCSSLLVSWFGDICKIWGIIYYAHNPPPLAEIPAVILEGRHFSPDSPTIELTGTGSLEITRSGSVIGRIERGEFKVAVPTPFHSRSMGPTLYGLFNIKVEGRRVSTEDDRDKMTVLFPCLEYLLLQIDKLGGGATVIFVPDSSANLVPKFAEFPWKSEGGLELSNIIQARIRYENQQKINKYPNLFVLKANKVLRERLDGLAQLASLDGAVLLTPSFELKGFGVKLQAPDYTGQVQEGPNAFGMEGGVMDFTRFGTRHNSTLRFVVSVPGSVGFVASEDGPIRGLAKSSSEVVYCWPDFRLSMFVRK